MLIGIAAPFSIAPVKAQPPVHFTIYALVPTSQAPRIVWAGIIHGQWRSIGIKAESLPIEWSAILARTRTGPKEKWGATYVDGGYDIMYNRYGIGGTLNPRPYWGKDARPPIGYFYYDNPEAEALLDRFEKSVDPDESVDIIKQYQRVLWEDVAVNIPIVHSAIVSAVSPKVEGFDTPFWSQIVHPYPERLTIRGVASPVTWVTAEPKPSGTMNPVFDVSGYKSWYGPVFNTLATINNWKEKKLVPSLAKSWDVSADGKTITINLQEKAKWHDGWEFTAEDVKFTWDIIKDSEWNTGDQFNCRSNLKDATYEVTGKHQITLRYKEYNRFWKELLFQGQSIVPKHVFEKIGPKELRTHPYSTGVGSYTVETPDGTPYETSGPIGTGPFIWDNFDTVGQVVTLKKNPNYWSEFKGNIEVYKCRHISTKEGALASLKSGEVTHLYNGFSVQDWVETMESEGWGKAYVFDNLFTQQVQLNYRHPIFGTGVDTPLGKADPSRASEAARYVRLAMSHAIPREEILEQLVAGFGKPGTGPLSPGFAESIYDELVAEGKGHPYDLEKAKEFLAMAGYEIEKPEPAQQIIPQWVYVGLAVAALVTVVSVAYAIRSRKQQP
jgi:ABC-type transport system substrate-binding protein